MEKIIVSSVLILCITACIIYLLKCIQIICLKCIERIERKEMEEIKNKNQLEILAWKIKLIKQEQENKIQLEKILHEHKMKEME